MTTFDEIISAYRAALTEYARWKSVKEQLNGSLKDAMGDASVGLVDDQPVIRKTVVHTRRFDSTLFVDEFPELADKYMIDLEYPKLTLVKPGDDAT